jgi:hypothetical protein
MLIVVVDVAAVGAVIAMLGRRCGHSSGDAAVVVITVIIVIVISQDVYY